MNPEPNYEGFSRAIMKNWQEHGDIDASEKFDFAVKYNLLIEIPGGFNPEIHQDFYGAAEPGDPWFAENY